MLLEYSSTTRRRLLAASVTVGAIGFGTSSGSAVDPTTEQGGGDGAGAAGEAIRPFRIAVPEAQLVDLRRRVGATCWPERETVTDASQGVQLETTQALAATG